MVTITLPPELEAVVSQRAQQQGTTPELYLLDQLRERYLPQNTHGLEDAADETLADFFVGYAGTVNSRELVSEGAHLSQDTGRAFTALLLKKRGESKK